MIKDLEKKNLFEILELDRKATIEDIEKSYFKLQKKYLPEKDPEAFKAVKFAYDTLSDPHSCQSYIKLMDCGGEISDALNRAYAAMAMSHYQIAQKYFQIVVNNTNEAAEALYELAMIQFMQNKMMTSANTLEQLADRFPNVELYRFKLGMVLISMYENETDPKFKAELIERARKAYERAIEINDENTNPFIGMAETYLMEEKYEISQEWIKKCLSVKKLNPFNNFMPLLFDCYILAHMDDVESIPDTLLKAEDTVPDYHEARYWAAGKIIDLCLQLLQKDMYEAMKTIALSVDRISPEPKLLSFFSRNVDLIVNAHYDLKELEKDQSIIKPIRDFSHYCFKCFVMKYTAEETQNALKDMVAKMGSWSVTEIKRSLSIFKRKYPALWELHKDLWNQISDMCDVDIKRANYRPYIWIMLGIWLIFKISSCIANNAS